MTNRMFRLQLMLAAATLLPAGASAANWGSNYFPNVALTTQDGKTVRFYDDLLKGKTVAIYLFYTSCHYSCPLETARVAQVQKILGDRVGRDIFFYSISIDPKKDTVAELKAYAERYQAGPGWTFLTGQPKDIELISRKLGLYIDPDPANKDGHTPSLLIGNEPTGQWMRNSALDNPKLLAVMIGQWLNSWKNHQPGRSYTEASKLNMPSKGQYVFTSKCAACHTLGDGDGLGPDLRNVTETRDRGWLARFIAAPDKLLAAGDPLAKALFAKYSQVRMPNLSLSAEEVDGLISFLDSYRAADRKLASAQNAATGR